MVVDTGLLDLGDLDGGERAGDGRRGEDDGAVARPACRRAVEFARDVPHPALPEVEVRRAGEELAAFREAFPEAGGEAGVDHLAEL